MRFALIVFLITTMSFNLSAQSRQQQKVDSVFTLVKKYFNAKNADAIYNMAGEEFQKELTINAFADVCNQQLFPFGVIKETSLISFVNNSLATYKLTFTIRPMQMVISLDKKDRIETLLFQPFDVPVANKTALVSALNPLKTETDRKVDSAARDYIQKANTVGICIGVIKGDATSTYSYGETIKGKGKLPNTDNFFELGSITKTFTSTLLAYYVNEGKVKLTDPITKFLPDSVAGNPKLKSITLLNLSNHTSGLPRMPDNIDQHATDYLNPYKDYDIKLMYAYLKTCKLNNKPGEKYEYSNLGVGLLGSILSGISGKGFEQMVTSIICKPLGMYSTAQFLNPLMLPRFPAVYNQDGLPTEGWDFDVLAPCGALRSTVYDMLIYAKANLHPGTDALGKAIALTHKVTFTKDVNIGLGWHIIIVNGVNYYFHNGGTFGSSSFMAFNPDKNIAVIVLSNSVESTDKLGVAILKKLQ
jgi:CubicO group peptidase (beta-lactamase class C family)